MTPCPHCGAVPTLAESLVQRLKVPATIAEFARSLEKPYPLVSSTLSYLKKHGKVRRTDNQVPIDKSERASKKGRRGEYLWEAV